jgi:hypothetical protein
MNIEEIMDMWLQDAKIDDVDLDRESLSVPNLHAKYLKILYSEKLKLRKFNIQRKTLNKVLSEYYKGDLNNPEDLRELQRDPWSRTILKQDINSYVDSDDEMIKLLTKIAYQEEVVSILEDILKSINNRGFHIKSAIDWRKLTNFGV